jgi:tetratricopeptide (TPR) repeat protein
LTNYFNQTIALEPDEASTYFERAGCYFDLRKYDQAILDYKKCLALNEKYAGPVNYSLGCTEALLDHTDNALSYLELAVKAGYKDKAEYLNSPNLVKLKDSPRFKELVSGL